MAHTTATYRHIEVQPVAFIDGTFVMTTAVDAATGHPLLVDVLTDADGNAWPTARTSNGVTVVPGLRVRDYNWRETTVTDEKPSIDGGTWDATNECIDPTTGTPWFHTANGGLFDGSRLHAL